MIIDISNFRNKNRENKFIYLSYNNVTKDLQKMFNDFAINIVNKIKQNFKNR